MPEFMITMDITFPDGMPQEERERLLAAEAQAAQPYFDSGTFARAWRTYGEHTGNHGHLALWSGTNLTWALLSSIYDNFPLVGNRCTRNWQATELLPNPNDPVSRMTGKRVSMWQGYRPVPLTWDSLIRFFDLDSTVRTHHGELPARFPVAPGVTVHIHPESGNPRSIHFMVGDVKVAELGPSGPAPESVHEDSVPGYVDFMGMWDHEVIGHQEWKYQIALDNGLPVRGL